MDINFNRSWNDEAESKQRRLQTNIDWMMGGVLLGFILGGIFTAKVFETAFSERKKEPEIIIEGTYKDVTEDEK